MLKRIFTTDVQIKLGSVILAILLWFFVVTDIEYYFDLDIPLRIDGLSEEKAFNNEIPEMITARFRGKGHTLLWANMTMPLSETGLILDLTKTKNTQVYYLNQYYAEHPDKFIMPRDYKLDLLHIVEPESIWVSVERMAHKELNINVQADIEPALGYMLVGDFRVIPSKVMVHGPVSLLNELTSITVPPFQISDVDADVSISLPISMEPSQLFSLDTSAVTLSADIQSIGAVEFTISFSNIPTALIFITKGKHSFQNTLSQTSFATATLVGNAVEFPFGLEQAKHIGDLCVIVFKLNLFPGSFWWCIT